ncbi:VOC family protein [Actinosynnema sp. NPDC059335]|uniref:VOC family protein n=1 Tax=Actinosynnema sp. NPDC059335 TaxID=3346804 RepID=UPI003670822F
MVVRTSSWPAGTPCWVDISTDVDRAVAFYGELFGWRFDVAGPEYGGYGVALRDGHPVAGVGPKQDPGQPSAWTTYLATDDVEASAEAVTRAGGQVAFGPMVVGDKGTMAVAADPTGVLFGLWQAGTNTGVDLANEPGSLVWNEHTSGDVGAAKRFYAEVFGYTYAPVEGAGDYSTIALPGDARPVGGIGAGAGGWQVYFQVADADEAVAAVRRLGGTVVDEPVDTPYGRMVKVADDQGSTFHLMGVPAE